MRFAAAIFFMAFSMPACLAAPESAAPQTLGLTVAILVNGEAVTARDIVQHALYLSLASPSNHPNAFIERVNLVLTGDTRVQEKFKQKMDAAQPHTAAEIQKAAIRIKKELVEEAIWQVLSADAAIKNAAAEAAIAERLKLQAARRFAIEINDDEVEKGLIVDRLAAGDVYGGMLPDMNAYYARREEYGISRRTIHEVMHAELAWRAVINRIYGAATGWERSGAYESFARGYLAKLRQHALVEHRK